MEIDSSFFLDVLCLTIYKNDESTERIARGALMLYQSKLEDGSLMNDETIQFYVNVITELIDNDVDVESTAETSSLILRFKQMPLCEREPEIVERLRDIIEDRGSISYQRITSMKRKLATAISADKSSRIMRKAFAKQSQISSTTDAAKQQALITDVINHARELAAVYEERHEAASTVEMIDMSCKDSLRRGMAAFKKKRVDKVYKMGLQGLNNMFGSNGGPTPGEFIGFAALSHHYKTGMLMDITRWLITLNQPPDTGDKKPCILFVSLENEVFENLMMWYRAAYDVEHGGGSDKLTNEDIIDYVYATFNHNGWKLIVVRRMGESFTYERMVKEIEDVEKTYSVKVAALVLDYITLMNPGEGVSNEANRIQNMVSRVKNYCNHHSILGVTGLQLDTAAAISATEGSNAVKRYGDSHLAYSKGIKRELDVMIFLHIETTPDGRNWLTAKLHKHKYTSGTSEVDKYFAYQFTATGLPQDVHLAKSLQVLDPWTESNVSNSDPNDLLATAFG